MNSYGLMQPSRLLGVTIAVSLLLHVVLALVLTRLDWSGGGGPGTLLDDAVELILVDDEDLPAVDDGMPRQIALMPERLETEPPEQADYLADVNSRAADLVPGGDSGVQPRASRAGDLQTVAINREQLEGPSEVAVNQSILQPLARPEPAAQPEPEPEVETTDQGEMATPDLEEVTASESADPDAEASESQVADYDEWLSEQRTPSLVGQGDRGFDFDQAEVGNVATNVDIVGGYRLNTYEWNFAPWIRRFANDLQRSWIPPYAYGLGIIHGRTEVRVVVERDGRPSRMDVLSREGHESLHTASVAALQACAPYLPLPPDFPEEQLVIIFTLIYPELRR